ncbi:MAG TPA: cytochrome c oxidase assembly protein [Acidimicrobiales bacterium]|nr:cytochrome c oxidase assembly protein [Acidimicrobiales bacterium]
MTPAEVVTQATFDPIPTVVIALTLGWYLWSVRRLARRGRRWPLGRTVAFVLGELFLAVGLISGMDAHDGIFEIHTIQHIFISMLAPVLFAFSAPITLALQASHRSVQTAILKVLHSPVGRIASNPIFTWAFYGASIFGLYFTSLYAITLRNQTVHDLVHLHLIVAGCLFWWPAVAVDPLPKRMSYGVRIAYLMLAMPFHTILGMALDSQTTRIAPTTTLGDLHAGGGLMWIAGEALGLIGTIAVFLQWLRADERAARRNDRTSEEVAALQLAHWRATREAAARAVSS